MWISGLLECCDVTDTSAFLASWDGFGLSTLKIMRPPIRRMWPIKYVDLVKRI